MIEPAGVVVVGGGPAGLSCAIELRRLGIDRVVVLEREPEAGGTPRHTHHIGFGIRDLHRVVDGPGYARRYTDLARRSGVEIRTETTAIGWDGPTRLAVTGPGRIQDISGAAVVLATGCRERPRAARLVPGDRPQGVLTTGQLQQLAFLYNLPIGNRAVIVGAEHVSFSAVHTLIRAGTQVAAMVTEQSRHQSFAPLKWATTGRHRVPVITRARVARIVGKRRVEAVEIAAMDGTHPMTIACDTVVFTGDWIPDHELAAAGGLAIDSGTRGPAIDHLQRTSKPGVFAAGNLLHGAETADRAALCGSFVAAAVCSFIDTGDWRLDTVPVEVEDPIAWATPNAVPSRPAAVPHGALILRVNRVLARPRFLVTQGDRLLHERRRWEVVPGRSIHLGVSWLDRLDPVGGAIRIGVA